MKSAGAVLTDVFVARPVEAPTGSAPAHAVRRPQDCLQIHRVHWQATWLSADGTQLICHFRAPDAESVRIALRQSAIPFEAVWTGRAKP